MTKKIIKVMDTSFRDGFQSIYGAKVLVDDFIPALQAAVSAGIVSPILIIIVAITALSSFAIPDYTFSFHLRVFRFLFILLGYTAGFLGIGTGLFVYISMICDMQSFGVSYSTPYSHVKNSQNSGIILPPIWKREYRSYFLAPQKARKQANISMKWKF